ncbi:MAG: LLM class F420-dependent oxidoreductase [Acidimicrobiaceae bacterium]|nr:LLM class F420-dependent oxidoreductase [Acidimicrobiaceae bacterium]
MTSHVSDTPASSAMKFSVTYPLVSHPYNPELLSKESLIRFAQTAENAGFDAMGFTDHPAPTHRWLSAGGHDALDPFAALAFVAAVTDRMLLVPNIVVLPYRNPFLVAKSIATIDALSGGRFVLATGTGYLKGEYKALGVDFDERNELFDEAIEVMRGVWANDDFAYEGRNFLAHGQSANPKPGRVPLWIGGNSKLSRRRVAEVADGWVPFPAPRALAHTTKTPPLETPEDLAQMLDYLWQHVDRAGRNRSEIDVCFGTSAGGSLTDDTFDADAHIAGLTELAALGVTWASATVPGDSIDHATEALQRYGEEVIATYQAS